LPSGEYSSPRSRHGVLATGVRSPTPCSLGTMAMSPCTSTATYSPFGDGLKPSARLSVVSTWRSLSFRSHASGIVSFFGEPFGTSSVQRSKSCWKTIFRPSGEMAGEKTPPEAKCVTCCGAPPFGAMRQMLYVPSRSDAK
jgi:hypothetical protein